MTTRTVTTKFKAEAGDYIATQKAMQHEVRATTAEMRAAVRQSLVARTAELDAAAAARTAQEAQDRAAHAARQARDAELEAAAARKLSAEAAESLRDGGLTAAEAERLEADAARKDERAQLLNAEAQRLAAESAEKLERASIKAAAAQLAQAAAARKASRGEASAAKEGSDAAELFGSRIGGLFGEATPYVAAGLAPLIPFIASALAGGVIAAIGGAGIGAAIAGQIKDPVVRAAWRDLARDGKSELTSVTESMAKPIADAARILDAVLQANGSNLTHFFNALAPAAEKLAHALGNFLDQALQGLPALSDALGPVLDAVADELPRLGTAVKIFFEGLSANSDGAATSLRIALLAIASLLAGLGVVIGTLETIAGAFFYSLRVGIAVMEKFIDTMNKIPGASGVLSGLSLATSAAADWTHTSDDAAASTKHLDDSQRDAADSARALAAETNKLNQQFDTYLNNALALSNATLQFKDQLKEFAAALRKTNGNLDENTSKGRANLEMFNRLIATAQQARDAIIEQGKANHNVAAATARANSAFDAQVNALIRQARQAGATKAQIDALLNSLRLVRDPVTGHIYVEGTEKAARQLQHYLNLQAMVHDKTVRITTEYYSRNYGSAPPQHGAAQRGFGQAHGGIVDFRSYAGGGFYDPAHIAQIVPAGTYRMFAEPETGGEAYIPLATSKRERSLAIWEETGRRLGVGMMHGSAAAAAPSFDVRVFVGNEEITGIVRTEIRANNRAIKRGAMSGTGTR